MHGLFRARRSEVLNLRLYEVAARDDFRRKVIGFPLPLLRLRVTWHRLSVGPVSGKRRLCVGCAASCVAFASLFHYLFARSEPEFDDLALEIIGLATPMRVYAQFKMSAEIGGMPPSCEALRMPRIALIARSMNTQSHEFVTADMRGLKAALVARAQSERVSVSVVIRRAVERELRLSEASREPAGAAQSLSLGGATVKLSIRLTGAEAEQLAAGARHAGLSRGAYLAGLLAGVPSHPDGSESRSDILASLNASCAELSTLSRNVHHLASLLSQGQVRAAMEYRGMLDTLAAQVRGHLALAAGLLAELRLTRPAHFIRQQRPRTTSLT